MDRTTSWEMPGEPARPIPPAEPVGTPPPFRGRWILAALVGAVVGALVSAGALLTFGDLGAGRTATRPSASRPSLALGGETLDIGAILERVEPAVVSISTRGFARDDFLRIVPSGGSGTGMILTPDGDVLTNAHVVAGASRMEAKLSDGRTLGATLVGADPSADVALIRLQNARDLPTVTLGRSAELQVGDGVVAIGNALALPGGPTVTSGIVSALDRAKGAGDDVLEHLIQTDAAINPGNSGGPLVSATGEVVGMNTAVIQGTGRADAQNIGFAIASDTFRPIVEQIRSEGGPAERAFLGVFTQTLTGEIRERLGIPAEDGALVVQVTPGTPAAQAGLEAGDVIIAVGDAQVRSSDELGAEIRKYRPGQQVEVRWQRGRAEERATVTLGRAPG